MSWKGGCKITINHQQDLYAKKVQVENLPLNFSFKIFVISITLGKDLQMFVSLQNSLISICRKI